MTQLIALEAGFYRGQRIRRGQEFTQVGGDVPKWAAVKDSPAAALKPEAVAADTKPVTTQKAVKAKVAGMTERA